VVEVNQASHTTTRDKREKKKDRRNWGGKGKLEGIKRMRLPKDHHLLKNATKRKTSAKKAYKNLIK